MHYVVSVSGGIASAATLLAAHKRGLDYTPVFADTTIEDDDLYRFLYDLEKVTKTIVYLRDGRDPWQVFADTGLIGNSRVAKCSKILKTNKVLAFVKEKHPASSVVLGMYKDEEDRLVRAQKNWGAIPVVSLLIRYGLFPRDADKLLEEYKIKPPRLYELGFPHNNCGGFCVRAGQGQFATLLARKPEFYARMELRNEQAVAAIRLKNNTEQTGFIRVVIYGETTYCSMREFRELVEEGTITPQMFEMGGCGCFVDDEPDGILRDVL